MQITCEKCSTTYALDERLLPPGGAPVQCTRCGHVFLAAPAGEGRSSTQVFGAGQMPGGFADEPEVKTKIFGDSAGAPAPQPEPPRASTQVFGAVGVPPPEPSQPMPTSTQIFGTLKVPPPEPPPASTQAFGAVKVPEQPAPSPSSTQIFGMGDLPLPPEPQRTRTHSMFEAPRSGLAGEPPTSPALRRNTQPFNGAAPPAEPPGASLPKVMASGVAEGREDLKAPKAGDPATAATMQMTSGDVQRALASRQRAGAPQPIDAQSAPTPAAGSIVPALSPEPKTEKSKSASSFEAATDVAVPAFAPQKAAYAKVELPPEMDVQELPGLASRSRSARRTAEAPAPSRRGRWILLTVAVLAAAGGGGLYGWRLLDRRLKAVPPEANADREVANALLRRDDPESRQRAIAQLERVLRFHPTYIDAEADLVTALALDADDARAEGDALEAQARALEAQIAKLNELQSPSDWQNRVNAMQEQAQTLRGNARPFEAQRSSSLQKMDFEYQNMVRAESGQGELSPATATQLARARALYFAVKGSQEATASAERYRALRGGGGWAEIALAELALNSDASKEALERSAAAMERAIAEDAASIRPRVLRARLASSQEDFEGAVSSLDLALALNPNHPVARVLRDRAEAALRQKSEAEQPPAPPDGVP